MKSDVTLGTVFCNGVHAVTLMWRSYYHHNKDAPVNLWCWDNDSRDGAAEYAAKHAAKVFTSNPRTSHQDGLDTMGKACNTPYMLFTDFDIEFNAPFTTRAIELLNLSPKTLCVSMPSIPVHGNKFPVGNFGEFRGTQRVNPCCALFRTSLLQKILERFSFGTYFNFGTQRMFYEVGAMIRQVAEVAGFAVLEPEWMWQAVNHYGQVGALLAGHAVDPKIRPEIERRYDMITKRTELYEEPPAAFGNP